ncbi:hypothetical protein [Streptomyces chrestomyceticus]|uniref:hypothetical protein n=1 Tax=Streptomyces chrestomyceticus TaxID=68185 RepID=UPI003789CE0D
MQVQVASKVPQPVPGGHHQRRPGQIQHGHRRQIQMGTAAGEPPCKLAQVPFQGVVRARLDGAAQTQAGRTHGPPCP